MQETNNLIAKITNDYPELSFEIGPRDTFHPPHTVLYTKKSNPLLILHEVGHYLIKETDFQSDIELLKIESLAWEQARRLCRKYRIKWDEDFAQDHLDSYRDYLYAASLCPNCNITGYQDNKGNYHCPLCDHHWPSPGRPE